MNILFAFQISMCDKSRNTWLCIHWQLMKHTRVVSTKCTPGFACRAFSDTTLVCFIVNEHTTKCSRYIITHPWASYQIPRIAGCACAGNAGNVFPRRRFQRKLLVSDPGMHHGTCVTHVPWCMSGSLTCGDGENVPGACAPEILRIWQEAHASSSMAVQLSCRS